MTMNRRQFLASACAVGAMAAMRGMSVGAPATTAAAAGKRYKISASDWMLLKRQRPGALTLGRDIGLDAIEVDMGPLGSRPTIENNFRNEKFLNDYLALLKECKLEVSSLAMSCFYGQPFADHPKADEFAAEWIGLMPKLGTKVGFLPIITKGSPTTQPAIRQGLVDRFKAIAPVAEKAGVVVGLNTSLTAEENVRLLDDIGSASVKIAYNIGEAVDAKRDPLAEIRTLGSGRISQIIPTLSDGKWLKDDERLDVSKLKGLLDGMGWSGYLVLQRSRTAMKGVSVKDNFTANADYLRSMFQG